MTYGLLLLYAFVRTIPWIVDVDLYYLQLLTIIAYHLHAHIMLLRYVVTFDIWEVGTKYDIKSTNFCKRVLNFLNVS